MQMRSTEHPLPIYEDLCVSKVMITSGIRPAGRTVDQRTKGRGSSGLLYIWEGCAHFWPEGASELSAGPGDLVYIPRDHRYMMRYTEDGTTFVLINFELTLSSGEPLSLYDHIQIISNDSGNRRIADIMAKLEICSAAENRSAFFRRKELVYRLFSVIFAEDVFPDLRQPKYANIIPGVLLLQQTYLENIPITELAAACSISVSSFRGLFTEQYGLSPIQYRNRLRINRARNMLIAGNCTVSEAAYASGFDNMGYFCRYYKKITGETPRETQLKNQ